MAEIFNKSSASTHALKKHQKGMLDITSSKELLGLLFIAGGIVSAMAISPALLVPAILVAQFKKQDRVKRKFRNTYNYLKRRRYITTETRGGEHVIILTDAGRQRAARAHLATTIQRPQKPAIWDKRWRIMIYDIPAHEKIKRDAFRHLIKKLGASQLQKSVWVYPFDCSEQIIFLKEFFGFIDTELRMIIANDIGDDRDLRRKFQI